MNFLTHAGRCSGSTAFVNISSIKAGLLLNQGERFEPHLITETLSFDSISVYFLYFQGFLHYITCD